MQSEILCDSGTFPNADLQWIKLVTWIHHVDFIHHDTIDNRQLNFLARKNFPTGFKLFADQTIRKLLGLKLISVLTMHHSIDNCNFAEISLMWPHLKGEKGIGKSVHTLQTLSTNRWCQSSELNHNGSNGERKSCSEREERERERGRREGGRREERERGEGGERGRGEREREGRRREERRERERERERGGRREGREREERGWHVLRQQAELWLEEGCWDVWADISSCFFFL